jgi:hypothetical protein
MTVEWTTSSSKAPAAGAEAVAGVVVGRERPKVRRAAAERARVVRSMD